MNKLLNHKQIDAVYNSDIRCINNHDVGVDDLQKIWRLLLENADKESGKVSQS